MFTTPRILGPVSGFFVGLFCVILSVTLLVWNEGRENLTKIASKAAEIEAGVINQDPKLQKKVVSVTGNLSVAAPLGDNLYLKPGDYVSLQRVVEMYTWVEKFSTGTSTQQAEPTYERKWTLSPQSSSSFKTPEGHVNPELSVDRIKKVAEAAKIGAYNLDMGRIALPNLTLLNLTDQNIVATSGILIKEKKYVYVPAVTGNVYENPSVGDVRVSYNVLPSGKEATVFGVLNGDKIDQYLDEKGVSLYRVFSGNRTEALVRLGKEFKASTVVLRILGFLLMWFGLSALLRILTTLTDFIPVVGSISRTVVRIVSFFAAFILTFVVVVVSAVTNNLIALVIILAVVLAVLYYLKKKKTIDPQS